VTGLRLTFPERCYALLLRAYPPDYRRRFGRAMRETFAHDHARVGAQGPIALGAFWMTTVVQAAWFGSGERLRRFRGVLMRLPLRVVDLLLGSVRQLRRQRLYAAACIATLALGVAAATSSLAVVKQAFVDPLPYQNGDRLVSLLTATETGVSAMSAHVLENVRADRSAPLDAFAPIRPLAHTFAGAEGAESIGINAVTPEYFETLGVQPAIGRTWAADEKDAVVVSWPFWQRVLGGNPSAIGRRLAFDNGTRTVVGVLPKDFLPPYFVRTDAWVPLDVAALLADPARGRRTLTVLARQAPGRTKAEVDAYLQTFTTTLRQQDPVIFGRLAIVARSLRHELVGTARPALLGTAAAAIILLLVVCANIAGLSAAQATARQRQYAIRAALGASRARMLAERFADSLVVAVVGSAAGGWLAVTIVTLVAGYQQQFLERMAPIVLDTPTLSIGIAVGIVAGVAASLLPQGALAGARPLDSLRSDRGSSADPRLARARSALVVAQVALAVVLVAGAGLLVRTVTNLSTMNLGFRSENMTTLYVNLMGPRYASDDSQIQFERDALQALERIPSVTAATASVGVPVVGGMMASLTIEGRSNDSGVNEIAYFSLAPGFLSAFEVPLKVGRPLLTTDDGKAPRVVLINETMARMFWPKGDAVGARVYIGPGAPPVGRWITVIGVVADMRQHGPTEWIRPAAFGSTLQYSWPRRYLTVRTSGPAAGLAADMRAAIRGIDPSIAVMNLSPLDDLISQRTARHRLAMLALGFFGVVAVVLCAFGLYAVVALTSQLRRREYAIRMALGETDRGVRWLVVRHALRLALAGGALGVVAAGALTSLLRGLLHGVEPLDPGTFGSAALAILTVAVIAAWLPARQAARGNPVDALKAD
jgi:putative ABC transport system permease protein